MGQTIGSLSFRNIELNNEKLEKKHDEFVKRMEHQHRKDMNELKLLNERLDKLCDRHVVSNTKWKRKCEQLVPRIGPTVSNP